MIKDLGEHALMQNYEGSDFTTVMMDGSYCLTKQEKKR